MQEPTSDVRLNLGEVFFGLNQPGVALVAIRMTQDRNYCYTSFPNGFTDFKMPEHSSVVMDRKAKRSETDVGGRCARFSEHVRARQVAMLMGLNPSVRTTWVSDLASFVSALLRLVVTQTCDIEAPVFRQTNLLDTLLDLTYFLDTHRGTFILENMGSR
ncbi:hypothetical protein M427DRAFT_44380 [Gonapodya prolifera JEL478]|uniref:Uncharacterized protein n=1 Tax=Gonapodya prolifera (strain JEL478) TaxID=1344416 RepID=A0A139AFJ2_GONPJ|nr:hypothetical protein M427DRAFT_44380 [Gonapodya prolifera JEL478]|eukprot:KXS15528.1 hypothetical protein M427DRAFT_44380 [Gonapodya prolifera JEL478]